MFLLLAAAFGAIVYAPLATLIVVRLRAENGRLRVENRVLSDEHEALVAENAALGLAFERCSMKALVSHTLPVVPPILSPAERLAYLFAFRHNVRGTPPGAA
jgi:hypothetical protein